MYERDGQDRIIVFTGPDGSGRKSVAEAVGQTFGMEKVVSYVTRDARPGEVNGQDYHFVTEEAFREMESELLQSVEIGGFRYGIRRSDVEEQLREKGCVYLVLNREGADRIKELYGDRAIRLFLYADRRTLEDRNRELGLAPDVIAARMRRYDEEMDYRSACEHAFGNYDLGDTVSRITETLEAYFQRGLVDKD
ncbi:guanylate kinase [Cohnella sp. CFH 77786]|uniref:guanylate kinase n=1 Tax=Cohnella sp. CFH 77786 TaxID=2662265 RepID=UPI001C60F8A5|nr:guanylate kinase [Cohnella sp. CFH 77786]MBW5446874.1 guanylate kinase [Cohnella sp. CFH 77786]